MIFMTKDGVGFIRTGCLVLILMMGLLRAASASDTNSRSEAETRNSGAAPIGAQDFLRSYLQIQEQLHLTQLAVEKNRQEAEDTAASNSVALEQRLRLMEKSAATENLDSSGSLDRTILVVAGGFAAFGFLVLLLAAFLQWTAVNRLAAVAAGLSATHAMQNMGLGEARLPTAHALEQSNIRFLGLMEQLQQRIDELETSAKPPPDRPGNHATNGHSNGHAVESPPAAGLATAAPDNSGMVNLLIGKSQALIKLNRIEAAIESLDEAISLDPGNADALVKKGAALERLQRHQEAIECYDRAIDRDDSLIMAYLHKGGLLNRLERHDEALACYELALKPVKTAELPLPSSITPGG